MIEEGFFMMNVSASPPVSDIFFSSIFVIHVCTYAGGYFLSVFFKFFIRRVGG